MTKPREGGGSREEEVTSGVDSANADTYTLGTPEAAELLERGGWDVVTVQQTLSTQREGTNIVLQMGQDAKGALRAICFIDAAPMAPGALAPESFGEKIEWSPLPPQIPEGKTTIGELTDDEKRAMQAEMFQGLKDTVDKAYEQYKIHQKAA